jgi:hypothetical protein
MTFTRVIPVDTSTSLESACARYYERFCERAKKELIIAEGIRSMIKLERNPQRPAAPRPKNAHGAGVDRSSTLVPGMQVSAQVVDAARKWASIPPDERRKQPGLAERLAVEVGVARSTLTRLGRRMMKGDL